MGYGGDSGLLDGRPASGAMTAEDGALPRYPIRAVSKLTGIGIDTLRAWERRLGAITPARDGRGRMYTDADVARLRLLRSAVDQGHSIGRLAALGDEELRHLAGTASAVAPTAAEPPPQATINTAALDTALCRFDTAGVDQEIAHLAAVLRPLALLRDVVMPLLAQVGDDWQHGRVGVPREHLMSAAIRGLLSSLLRLYVRQDAPVSLLFTTLPGERHEIGTLGAGMLAASSGLGVAYLGADLPTRDIVQSVKAAGARALVLGLTSASSGKAERSLRSIIRTLPRDVELWVGGPDAGHHAATVNPRGIVLRDYDAFQQELVRLGGRVN